MATRPTVDLDWAENDVVDPTSGQNNKVEPPTAWKINGWSYQEPPPRNYDNYHKWNTGQWIKYLDEVGTRPATYFVAATDAAAETKRHADAVCDGTDDHTEIYAAITSVASTGGKVLLSEGTFTVAGAITISGDVHLQGMGIGATTIKIKDSDTGDYTIVDIDSTGNVTVSDLTIDGNKASATGNNVGIEVTTCAGVTIERVEILNIHRNTADGYGIQVTGGAEPLISGCIVNGAEGDGLRIGVVDTAVSDCKIRNCKENGIYCETSSALITNCYVEDSTLSGVVTNNYTHLAGCRVSGNGGQGIDFGGDQAIVMGCRITGNGVGGGSNGLNIDNTGNHIAGCIVTANGGHGANFLGSASECHVIGCYIHGNGQKTHNNYSGVYFTSSASENTVADCKVRQGGGANKQKYGIDVTNVTAATDQNYVYTNDCVTGGATASLSPTGTARTIPLWTGAGASSNNSDDITVANRT